MTGKLIMQRDIGQVCKRSARLAKSRVGSRRLHHSLSHLAGESDLSEVDIGF